MDKLTEAMKYVAENNYEPAVKLLIEYIDEKPENPIGYINLANLLVTTNQHEEAERLFLQAIQLDDSAATAYYGLGNLYYNNELYDKAVTMFRHCMKLGLVDGDVYFMLGMTYVNRHDKVLALPFLQRASELQEKPETMFPYGLTLAQTNYLQEAKEVFEAIVKMDSTHADALYNLGIIAIHDDHIGVAKDYFNQVLQVNPTHTLAQEAMANIMK